MLVCVCRHFLSVFIIVALSSGQQGGDTREETAAGQNPTSGAYAINAKQPLNEERTQHRVAPASQGEYSGGRKTAGLLPVDDGKERGVYALERYRTQLAQ